MKGIATELDYQSALQRLDEIFFAAENTPEGDEANLVIQKICTYEDQHFRMTIKSEIAIQLPNMNGQADIPHNDVLE